MITASIRDLYGRPEAIAAAMGITSPTGRDLHVARRILDGGEHGKEAVATLLETYRLEDQEAETARIASVREKRARTVQHTREFVARRAAIDAPPPNVRVLHVRDEISRELVRLHVPLEFFAD